MRTAWLSKRFGVSRSPVREAVMRLAAANRTKADLRFILEQNQQYKHAVKSKDIVSMINQNHAFHLAIGRASHNQYFTYMYSRLLNEGRHILRVYYRWFNDEPPAEMVNSHDRMVDAIERKDIDLADQLAQQHAKQLSDGFIRYLSQRQTDGINLD